jgi:lipopolysaccharide export system protein LptA
LKISGSAILALLIGVFMMLTSPAWAVQDDGIAISSDRLQIQEGTNTIRFEGSVEVVLPEGLLSCDLLIVRADVSNPSRIKSGEATGNVVLTRGSDRVEAQKALFDLEAGNVELTGSPRLIREETTIQAETIIYSMDQGTATFSGPVKAIFRKSGDKPDD